MAYRSLRLKFTLPYWPWPDLAAQPRLDDSGLAGSAMLGTTLVQGLALYTGLAGAMDFYCDERSVIGGADEYVTRLCENSYRRVYIEYGMDDLYRGAEGFREIYAGIVDRIRSAMPEAEIYVMSLTPVTRERSDEGYYSIEQIRAFNAALFSMCEEKHCWYLDAFTPLCGEDGYLRPEYIGWDGSPHLSTEAYLAWEELVRTYYR